MFESTRIIAQKQFEAAKELYAAASERITGPVSFQHQFVDMTNATVHYSPEEHVSLVHAPLFLISQGIPRDWRG